VAAALARVRPGEVVTYGEVAAEAGHAGAHRAVGRFLRDHDGHPWWRVVTASGRLVPGHEEEQARLLEAEGVAVRAGRVRTGSNPVRVRAGILPRAPRTASEMRAPRRGTSGLAARGAQGEEMTSTFASLGVAPDLVAALTERGIESPFTIQELTIPDALAGRDVCGKAKTGSGKTLAFGLPIVQRLGESRPREPLALILVPTRELATQVKEELEPLAAARGRTVLAIYGGAPMEKQVAELVRGVDLVVATPGRLIDLIERKELSIGAVSMVVIDEADRMADMGFMPQVEWVLRHIDGSHQTLLFSATLDGMVDGLIRRYQADPVLHEVAARQVTVDEMHHRFLLVHQMDKTKVAAAIARSAGRTIMFTRTKFGADRLVRDLTELGVKAAAIHGDLRQTSREKALAGFMAGSIPVLVATDVAARGIHVDEIDVVIHFDPPQDHKAYLHRSGRTARAGMTGLVVTLILWNEEVEIRRMLRRLGISHPLVEMFSNDPRLADLVGWDPRAEVA
jgi:superfamily II DNA/RNA helicase/alkylated DNA nucleotide flippase Atl1